MTSLARRIIGGFRALFHRQRMEQELDEELREYLTIATEQKVAAGMRPEDALRAARVEMGSPEAVKDRVRDVGWESVAHALGRDAQYAVRLLRRNPMLTLTATLSLAVGIGANTAIFTVANALLFRAPVGVADPEGLVDIGVSRNDGGFNPGSYPTYLDVRRRTTTLNDVYAHHMFPHAMSLSTGSATGTERIFGQFVTMNYFVVLGARAAAGRLFDASAREEPGANPIVVLSHRFWTRRFNRALDIVGQTVRLNGHPFTVIGVASEGFQGTGLLAGDVWLPLTMVAAAQAQGDAIFSNRASAWLVMGGRLEQGRSVSMAAAEVEAIGRDLARDYPDTMATRGLRLVPSSPVPGNRNAVAAFVALLTGIVSLVLLVASANLSGLLLARAAVRRREIAVRLAIGAGRMRLVRQLLMETMALFVLGAVAGLVLAHVMTRLLVAWLPALPFPVAVSFGVDTRVIAFTAGLSLLAALASGLAPALQASAGDPVIDLKDGAHGPPGRSRLRHAFVVAQVAFSIVLIVSAGLFARALERAGSTNPGFDPRGVELASLDLSMAGYTPASGPRFARELIERVRQLPNVDAATIACVLPGGFETVRLGGLAGSTGAPFSGEVLFYPDWSIVEPDYFATLRVPLVAGRDFSAADHIGSPRVAIIDESLARRFWPGESAIGKSLVQHVGATEGRTLLVIGVAGDIRSSSLVDGLSEALVYVPLQQQDSAYLTSNLTVVARSRDGQRMAEPIRFLVRSMDANLPVVTSQTLEESLALGLVPQRVAASISGSLGLVGLLLAAIGIYGVTAYAVASRTREIGIRVALGAEPTEVVSMVLRHGLSLTIIGSGIGVVLAAGASRLWAAWLLGVPPLDPLTFTTAAALCVVIGLAACYVPARRATRVDAMIALRCD